jgi:single-strand DNA-binding protein
MSYLPQLSGEFTVVADPELKFGQGSGTAVARVRLVANSRKLNKETNEWEDADTLWMTGTAFGRLAENIAESVTKGSRVVVQGRLKTDSWEKDGQKKSATALTIDKLGVDLMFDPARSYKKDEQGGSQPSANPWEGPSSDAPPF